MRTPSRKMPKASQFGWPGWLATAVVLGLIALILGMLARIWWPLAFLVPAVMFVLSAIGSAIVGKRKRRIVEERKGESICQFARAFDCRTIDTWIIRAVYEEFSRSFPLRASDRLEEDLLVDEEELEFSANHIARRTRRSLEGYERNPVYGRIKTLRDLVMFFHHQPLVSASPQRQ